MRILTGEQLAQALGIKLRPSPEQPSPAKPQRPWDGRMKLRCPVSKERITRLFQAMPDLKEVETIFGDVIRREQ